MSQLPSSEFWDSNFLFWNLSIDPEPAFYFSHSAGATLSSLFLDSSFLLKILHLIEKMKTPLFSVVCEYCTFLKCFLVMLCAWCSCYKHYLDGGLPHQDIITLEPSLWNCGDAGSLNALHVSFFPSVISNSQYWYKSVYFLTFLFHIYRGEIPLRFLYILTSTKQFPLHLSWIFWGSFLTTFTVSLLYSSLFSPCLVCVKMYTPNKVSLLS